MWFQNDTQLLEQYWPHEVLDAFSSLVGLKCPGRFVLKHDW
jgi:hypothetical protein